MKRHSNQPYIFIISIITCVTAMDPAKSTTIRSLASHHVNLGTRIIKFYSVSLKITHRLSVHIYLCKPGGPCQRMQLWGASGNAQCRAPCWGRNRCPWDRTWVNRIIEDEYRLDYNLVENWTYQFISGSQLGLASSSPISMSYIIVSVAWWVTINVATWSQKWALMK